MASVEEPFLKFEAWFGEAREKLPSSAVTVAFSTAAGNRPSVRPLRLVNFSDCRFHFISNYGSRKVQELLSNPRVAFYFWWADLGRCVRVEGRADVCDDAESISSVFRQFPLNTRQAMVAAGETQSQPGVNATPSRERLKEVVQIPGDQLVPPATIRLIVVHPDYFEFYDSDPSLIADRTVFALKGDSWEKDVLGP